MNTKPTMELPDDAALKDCCARIYESDFVKLLIGDSMHPGGLPMTGRLGEVLRLTARSRVLDVACGRGVSAVYLAERFGCEIQGIDYSDRNLELATAYAATKGMADRIQFNRADAERIPASDNSFDAVVCECAFCLFPNKNAAAAEFSRVLRAGGRIGMSDLTRSTVLPDELQGLIAWMACIADAKPVQDYVAYLTGAGMMVERLEEHNEALIDLVNQIHSRLLVAEVLVGMKKLNLIESDLANVKRIAKHSLAAIQRGQLGYAVIAAVKRSGRYSRTILQGSIQDRQGVAH